MMNIGSVERVLRVVVGGILALWALSLFSVSNVLVWQLLAVALVALDLDFVVTGVRGYCPLYDRLGWSTVGSRTE